MSCCPPNSEPHLLTDYTPKGTVSSVDGVDFYSVGNASSKTGIIIFPDAYGWNGGRTRNIADRLADFDGVGGNGSYVVIPKLLVPAFEGGIDGDGMPGDFDWTTRMGDGLAWMATLTWDAVGPRVKAVLKHMIASGVSKIGLLGFCWGGWVVAKMLGESDMPQEIVCGVSPHPSITNIEEYAFKRNAVELCSLVKRPVLLLPAGNDPDRYRPGGDVLAALQARPRNSPRDHTAKRWHHDRQAVSAAVTVKP